MSRRFGIESISSILSHEEDGACALLYDGIEERTQSCGEKHCGKINTGKERYEYRCAEKQRKGVALR